MILDLELLLILLHPLCFFLVLEARLGFANENGGSNTDDAQQINGLDRLESNALTLAVEFDTLVSQMIPMLGI